MSELVKRLDESMSRIGNMCSEGRPPKMSIPARPEYDDDLFIIATIKSAIARITELEASLADSNEALQVMGLKLAHAEAENARLSGEREQLNEQLRKMGADWLATAINGEAEKLPATRIKNLVEQHGSYRKVGELLGVDHAYLHRIAHGEKDNMSDDMLLKLGLRRGTFYAAIDTHSANTVGGPTPVMDAAPACERNQVIKECAAACAEFVNKWNQTSIDRLQAGRTSDSLLWAGHAAGANLCHGAIMALMANCSNEDARTESDS